MSLFKNDNLVSFRKINVGAAKAKGILRKEITEVLENEGLQEADIQCIIASGMITSDLGLCEVAHIALPVKMETLAKNMEIKRIENITTIPFCFIPGVKNSNGSDFMRGEETEFFGMNESIVYSNNLLTVLPGSHTKFILSNKGIIRECITTLSGEMLYSLMSNTILKSSLKNGLGNINKNSLIDGYRYAKENGLNKTLFFVRVLEKNFNKSVEELRGFFIGAVLSGDIDILKKSNAQTIAVGGSAALREIFCFMIKALISENVLDLGENSENMQAIGALKIAKGVIKNGKTI